MIMDFQSSVTLESALQYASLGYPVFPLKPNSKVPAIKNGVHGATTDKKQIRDWFTNSNYNIGLSCKNILTVDCDLYKSESLAKWYGMLDEENIPVQITPRGGQHFLFKRPDGVEWRNSSDKIEPGVDTRTDGGYIVVAPSSVDGNEYYWDRDIKPISDLPEPPDWLTGKLNYLFSKAAETMPKPVKPPVWPINDEHPVFDRARKYLASMPESISGNGGHNALYAAATALVHGFELSVQDAENMLKSDFNPRCRPMWSDNEISHKVQDAANKEHDKHKGWLKNKPNPVIVAAEDEDEETQEQNHENIESLPEDAFRAPGFISEYLDTYFAGAPYPSMTLGFCGAVTMQSFLSARKVQCPGGIRPNVYIVALANPGGGKDYPRKINHFIASQLGRGDCLTDQLASGPGLYDALAETKMILCQTDEVDSLIRSLSKGQNANTEGIFAALLNLYSASQSIAAMRKKVGNTKREPIDQPYLTVFGTAPPKLYYEALNEQLLTNGFFARTMIFQAEKRPLGQEGKTIEDVSKCLMPHAQQWHDHKTKFQTNKNNGNLRDSLCVPDIVEMTNEALYSAREFQTKCDLEYQDAEDNQDVMAMTIWGRANENMRKLALIYACSESVEQPRIKKVSIDWATRIIEFQVKKQLYLAERYAMNTDFEKQIERAAAYLTIWKKGHPDGRMPLWIFRQRMRLETYRFENLITELVERRIAIIEETPRPGKTKKTIKIRRVKR